jgi:hypothetical protein
MCETSEITHRRGASKNTVRVYEVGDSKVCGRINQQNAQLIP